MMAPVQFFVVGNNDLSEGMVATQNHVTAVLPFQVESNLAQCSRAVTSRNHRETTHTATPIASIRRYCR